MKLASKNKQEEHQALKDLWDIIGIGLNSFVKNENPAIMKEVNELLEFAERFKEITNTHDYTEDDERIARVDKLLTTCQLKQQQKAT